MTQLWTRTCKTPIGRLVLVADDVGLTHILLPDQDDDPPRARTDTKQPVLARAVDELTAWFAGERRAFTVPIATTGTEWQRRVWAAVAAIPFGERRTYAEIAAAVDRPKAHRAVGLANSRNPIPIVVPCHRVVGSDGALAGYSGGVEAKAWLLAHEQSIVSAAAPKKARAVGR